jgi:protein TonB
MNQCVDSESRQVQSILTIRGTRDFFGRMLAISLALHVISTLILLTPHSRTFKIPSVTYLDLNDIKFREPSDSTVSKEPLPAEAAPAKSEITPPPPPAAPRSEAERLQQEVKQTLANAETNPDSLQERSFGLGLTNGYFSSIADGESLRSDIKDYYLMMLREINEKWWLANNGNFGGFRGAIVQIVIARNGTIIEKTLSRSSGNRAFDRAIFTALEKANPLPPLPDNYQPKYFSAPLRFVAPLNLFAS